MVSRDVICLKLPIRLLEYLQLIKEYPSPLSPPQPPPPPTHSNVWCMLTRLEHHLPPPHLVLELWIGLGPFINV